MKPYLESFFLRTPMPTSCRKITIAVPRISYTNVIYPYPISMCFSI